MSDSTDPEAASGVRSRLVAICREFLAALRYLTLGPPASRKGQEEAARGAAVFPLLGLALGAGLVHFAQSVWPGDESSQAVLFILLCLSLLGGAAFPRGLAATASALPTPRGAAAGPGWRICGWGIAILVVVLKGGALWVTPAAALGTSLPLAMMLGRWAIVVQAYGSQSAGERGVGAVMPKAMVFGSFAIASVSSMAVCLIVADAIGLILLMWAAAQTIGFRILVHARMGGVTRSTLAAGGELAETVTLLFGAGLARALVTG